MSILHIRKLLIICVFITSFSTVMVMLNENTSALSTHCDQTTESTTIHQHTGGTYNATSNLVNAVTFVAICNPDLAQPPFVGMTFSGIQMRDGATPQTGAVGLSQCEHTEDDLVSVECQFDIRTAHYDETTGAYFLILLVQFPADEFDMSNMFVQSNVESGTACVSTESPIRMISDQNF